MAFIDIFRVGPSDVNEGCRHFYNLDIAVFRPSSTPVALHLPARERAQSATPSDSQGAVCCEVGAAGC